MPDEPYSAAKCQVSPSAGNVFGNFFQIISVNKAMPGPLVIFDPLFDKVRVGIRAYTTTAPSPTQWVNIAPVVREKVRAAASMIGNAIIPRQRR